MPPKKDHSETLWRTTIEDFKLDEEKWTVKVIMIEAAEGDQNRLYISKFEEFAAGERRFVIKNICRTETIFMINQLGGEKKTKDDSLRVFEEGQAYLKEKKDIPPDILALIIKHLIIKMKEEYLFIQRQRLIVQEGVQRETATMIGRDEVKGLSVAKSSESQKGKKKVIDVPEPVEGKKYKTELRERGEEWRDKVYVDDFPLDGPNIYVALTGFVDPCLPVILLSIGVPLAAIVQVRINVELNKVPSTLIRSYKRGQSITTNLASQSVLFWEKLQELRIDKSIGPVFRGTFFVIFSPPYRDSAKLSGNPDDIYDELCYIMYDVQDLSRQHGHYLDNMDIMNIPEEIPDEKYQHYYNTQIESLPLESVTIYSLLDSILQTVTNSDDLDQAASSVVDLTPSTVLSKHEKVQPVENLVNEVFFTLCSSEKYKKSYRLTYGEEYEKLKDPKIINYGDFAKYTTFHLGNINLDNIVASMLAAMPIHKLWNYQDLPNAVVEAKVNYHVNVLLSCFQREDIETAELNRMLHMLACRKIYNNRSSLKRHHIGSTPISEFKKIYLKRSIMAEPLKQSASLSGSYTGFSTFPSMSKTENISQVSSGLDPETNRVKYIFECPDISELVSAAEIATEQPINHIIEDFQYFEDFSGIQANQILLDALNKFNCVDYKYCEVTDCFIMMFYNNNDKDGISRDEWRCHIPTPVCQQDFFDFVLEENYEWVIEEEKLYDNQILKKIEFETEHVKGPSIAKSCTNDLDVSIELLMEGSIKHQELLVEEESSYITTSTKTTPSGKKTLNHNVSEVDKKSVATSTPKVATGKQSITLSHIDDETFVQKEFLGYDLGDRRVEVFGKDATFYSLDGTRVSSLYTLIIPNDSEFGVLNVIPGYGKNSFWVHKAMGINLTPQLNEICLSFRIDTRDRALININKRSYIIPAPLSTSTEPVQEQPPVINASYHSLIITWPNGLITESIHEENSSKISHIKQFYLTRMPDINEDMRCISLSGEVIIFRPSGIIEVLKPDSTMIKITKAEKSVVRDLTLEPISEPTPDKGKSSKLNKSSPKASKSKTGPVIEEKPLEYELIIEEFEVNETSGLRQKWTNNVPHDIEKLLVRTATDYTLGQIYTRRMDGTSILWNKDGDQIVTFPDKTRIITTCFIDELEVYPEWTDEEKEFFEMLENIVKSPDPSQNFIDGLTASGVSGFSGQSSSRKIEDEVEAEQKEIQRDDGYLCVHIIFTVEHDHFTTVIVNDSSKAITVNSPNETSVIMRDGNNFNFVLSNSTTATFDGETLNIDFEACPDCRSTTTCQIKMKSPDELNKNESWLKLKDSFDKIIVVDQEGGMTAADNFSDELLQVDECALVDEVNTYSDDKDGKSESSVMSHGKCKSIYDSKRMRFLVLRRDLTCSELVHKLRVEEYQRECRWQPWCSINSYNTFGDNRRLVTMLTPINITEAEKWLMNSTTANKPDYLTYKDLKKDDGKGFYHWMRPYKRFYPEPIKTKSVIPHRLPRAYLMRILEQQWSDDKKMKGCSELSSAILRYRRIMEADYEEIVHIPVRDMRSSDERLVDDMIQALGHRIYQNLRFRIEEDVLSRAKHDITTEPPPELEEVSQTLLDEEDEEMKVEELESERSKVLDDVAEQSTISPKLRSYWRRRNEEYKEEQFYLYLLREGTVPPYFKNVLGGAMWWDINQLTANAAERAERRKMKCVCAEEATSSNNDA